MNITSDSSKIFIKLIVKDIKQAFAIPLINLTEPKETTER